MKIAVYTIALNEEKHVARWQESAKEADLLLIADTGSTDKTKFIAKSLGISVYEISVDPWRFDVARNASLALIPEDFDICIQLDMDETLSMGWRKKVEEAFLVGNNWPIYKIVISRNSEGKPRNYLHHFKIHPRKGFIWKYPIHEVLVPLPGAVFKRELIDVEVDHVRDQSKPRNKYLNLLEIAVKEDPKDWRMNHYLNREYFYNRNWLQVLKSGYKCSEIKDGWDVERASTYMWMSEAARWLDMMPLAKYWASEATKVAPEFYEAWHWRAHIAHLMEEWSNTREFASKIETLHKGNHHLVKPEVWEWWGFDLIALASHKLEDHNNSVFFGEKALFGNPYEKRLINNLQIYRTAQRKTITSQVMKSLDFKLNGLPMLRILHCVDLIERKAKLLKQLSTAPSIRFKFYESTRCNSTDYQDIANSILDGHLLMLRDFLEKSDEEWTLIVEDDFNFDLVEEWPFTWREFFDNLQKHKIQILQAAIIVMNSDLFISELHRRKEGFEWSSACYVVSRLGAKMIVDKIKDKSLPVESNLFDGLPVFSDALFSTNHENDSFHSNHKKIHTDNSKKAIELMRARAQTYSLITDI